MLCCGDSVFSQEWEAICEYSLDNDTCAFLYDDVTELSNGRFLVNSSMPYKSGVGDFYSNQPALAMLSSSGKEIVRKDYFRPGYCTTSNGWTFENKDGELFLLLRIVLTMILHISIILKIMTILRLIQRFACIN